MFAAGGLAAFLLAVALIELTPGPNMGYLAMVASRSGRAAGMMTVAGVTVGLAIYLAASVLGLAEAALRWPWLYQGLRWAGVAYLAWLAFDAWRGAETDAAPPHDGGDLFLRGLINNLLNPKAAVFYIALLPEFVRPEAGRVAAQALTLGAIHIAVSFAVHTAIVWGAAGAKPALDALNRGAIQKLFAAGLAGIAVWLAITTR